MLFEETVDPRAPLCPWGGGMSVLASPPDLLEPDTCPLLIPAREEEEE